MGSNNGKAASQYDALLRSMVRSGMTGADLLDKDFKRVKDGLRLTFTVSWDLVGKLDRRGHEAVTAHSEKAMSDHDRAGPMGVRGYVTRGSYKRRQEVALIFDDGDDGDSSD